MDSRNIDYLFTRLHSHLLYKDACSNYLEASFEKCISILSELVHDDTYHDKAQELMTKAKKIKEQTELGNSFYVKQNFVKAYQIYNEVLKIDPSNGKIQSILHQNLAETSYNLLDYTQGVKDATAALQHNPRRDQKCIEALVVRAKCYFKLERYEESVQDCRSVLLFQSNEEMKNILNQCRLEYDAVSVNMQKAKDRFNKKQFSESKKYCNMVLDNLHKTHTQTRYQYKTRANLLLEEIRKHIEQTMLGAKYNFSRKNFDQCIKNCEYILNIEESVEAKNLLRNANSEKQVDINDKIKQAKKYYEIESFKDCIQECNDILKIRGNYEISQILLNIRGIIKKSISEAKRNLKSEFFDQCILECEFILNIEYSKEADDYLKAAKTGKIHKTLINEGLERARMFNIKKMHQHCIDECKKILRIKEVGEAIKLMKSCEAAIETIQSETIKKLMKTALKFYEMEDYKNCFDNCYKVLNIKEHKEARDLIKNANIEKNKMQQIHDAMIRANQHLRNEKYKECISECENILLRKDFEVAKILMKKAKALMNEKVINKIMERARKHFNQTNFEECILECQKALQVDPSLTDVNTLMKTARTEIEETKTNFVKNEKIRAELHFSKAEYKECIDKCLIILGRDELFDVRDMLVKCRTEIEYDNLTNNHDILQVDENAGKEEIITSFRSLSLKYHPDKHSNSTKEMKKHCEKIFKKLSTAYRELTK